jgi:hypothetical protein
MQVYRWKAVNMSLEIFPNGEDEREDAEESSGMRANLSFIAIHKARTTDFWVSPPSHHCRRPKGGARGWRKLVCGLAWASLLPCILGLVWVLV